MDCPALRKLSSSFCRMAGDRSTSVAGLGLGAFLWSDRRCRGYGDYAGLALRGATLAAGSGTWP